MKAIVVSEFGDEQVLHYTKTEKPKPGNNELRVRIKAAGVNPVEAYIRSGKYSALPSLPYTPGNDGAGIIDAVGQGVQMLQPGRRVFVAATLAKRNTGTYAEYVVCDADAVWPLPDTLSFSEGAGLGTPGLAAAYAIFSKAGLRPGQTVLIHGATGGVGTLAVQLARKAGGIVYATSGSKEGEALLNSLGVHRTFNHKQEGYIERIRDVCPNGVDCIVEMLANVNLTKDLSLIARGGRIVIVGNKGSLDFNPRDIMQKDAGVHGMLITNMDQVTFREHMFRLSAGLENGMHVLVKYELPLREAPQAHTLVAQGGKAGKIVLVPEE